MESDGATDGGETALLCSYAAQLRYEDLPTEVVRRAKDCITDTVAAMLQGRTLPWSQLLTGYAAGSGGAGRSTLFGHPGRGFDAAAAAFGNGALAHSFELDSLTYPSAGTHPGANLVPAALAVAQEADAGGRGLITAIVAGCEVLNRVGRACGKVDAAFHQPGIFGPIGGAVATVHILKLDAGGFQNAVGLAASLGSGLMAFAASQDGGMVKKLHLGRAAEGGVLAGRLAAAGVNGPSAVFEGRSGVLDAYSQIPDREALCRGLGTTFETLTISLKRFAAHINAHTPMQALLNLKAEHGFDGADIAAIEVFGSDRMVRHNGDRCPTDLMMAQYSVPFCMALAAFRDPQDPASFAEGSFEDPAIQRLCRRITVAEEAPPPDLPLRTRVGVTLHDARVLEGSADSYPGMPLQPADTSRRQRHFLKCAGANAATRELFERLDALEIETRLDFIVDSYKPLHEQEQGP